VPPPALGSTAAVETSRRRGFCSVRRFAGESSAAAATVVDEEEPENGFVAGDQQVCV
jgi:2-oxoisovalerate dehydrogenase E1 component alpha subunit